MNNDKHVMLRHLDAPILWYWFKPIEAKLMAGSIVVMMIVCKSLYGLVSGVLLGYFLIKKLHKIQRKYGSHILGRWRYFNLPTWNYISANENLPKSYFREFIG